MERIRIKLSPSKPKGRKILSQKSPLGRPIPVITGMGGVLRDIESKNSQKIDELSQGVFDQGLALNNEIIKQGAITSNAIEGVRQESVSVFNELGKHILANNPHGITKETIGLNRVENTADIEKPVSIPVQMALNQKADKEELVAIEEKIEESIKGQEKIKNDLSSSMNIIGGVGGESLVGGKKGQVLKKVSNKDGDYTWQDESASKTHNELEERDVENCHPISAITNLQTELNGKQPTISDLDEIRSGASAGSTALQPSALDGYATETWVGQQGYLTGITSSDVTTALGYTPQQQLESGTNIKTVNSQSLLGSGNLDIDGLPSQTGNAGKFLTTDGTDASWGVPKTHNLFDFIWRDAELNDMAWLRADTFSWQDGTVYTEAYNHLVDDVTNGTSQTETISGHTITYTLADDGHKIVSDANASEVEGLYNDTGVAWYYILDLVNHRFKLPRTKYGFTGLRDTVGKYVPESLPNIKGSSPSYSASGGGKGTGALKITTNTGRSTSSSGHDGYQTITLDASLSSSTNQDNAPVQQRATQMYLYFYVGQFTQTATEQTAGLNSELFNSKADLDGGNVVASAGSDFRNISKWSSNVTNCITYIPQDIKLELDSGTLTLKAGSKVYVPNGDGVFDEVTVASDISRTESSTYNATYLIFYTPNGDIGIEVESNCFSGGSAPTGQTYMNWYDTTNNLVKRTSNGGSTWTSGYSLPIAICTQKSGSGWVSIDQVFNGFGYIGSTVFALPGVKGLIPNGRNADGTLKCTPFTTSDVLTQTNTNIQNSGRIFCISGSGIYRHISYNLTEDNYLNTNDGIVAQCYFVSIAYTGYKITSFNPKTVFHALDYNDKYTISGWGMPGDVYEDMSSLSYTAPANGYAYFQASSGTNNGFVIIKVNDGTPGFRQIGDRNASGSHSASLLMPVRRGEPVSCAKESSGVTYANRFIYAEGEV